MGTLPTVLLQLEDLSGQLTRVQAELDMSLMRMSVQNQVVCEVLSKLETVTAAVRAEQAFGGALAEGGRDSNEIGSDIYSTTQVLDAQTSAEEELTVTATTEFNNSIGTSDCTAMVYQEVRCLLARGPDNMDETVPSSRPGLLKNKQRNSYMKNNVVRAVNKDCADKIESKAVTGTLSASSDVTKSQVSEESMFKGTQLDKTCVSVILKSSRLNTKPVRLSQITMREHQVEQLVSLYSLKFGHKTSHGVQVRHDYCFFQSAEALQFYNSVLTLDPAVSPKFVSCFLLSEAELGYQYRPVLSEQDLLAIHSSEYCKNIFRTGIPITVVWEGDLVAYHFKTVTEVNKFLFNKSKFENTRSLGQLRSYKVVPKKFLSDEKGFFRLITSDSDKKIKSAKLVSEKLQIKPACQGGNHLLFSDKLDLFKFLVSDSASKLDHLQFDDDQIVNCKENIAAVRKGGDLKPSLKVHSGMSLKTVNNLGEKMEDFKFRKLELQERIIQMKALDELYQQIGLE